MKNPFVFDTRSLAMARIFAALCVLGDLFYRAEFLVAHYTRDGTLPAVAVFEELRDVGFPTLFFVNDSALYAGLVFVVLGFSAISLLLGYQTRLATALSWYLYTSIQYRNPLINTGGDILLKFLLLWAIFLPWGERWSVDSLLRGKGDRKATVFSLATTVFGLQMVLLYLSSTLNKWHPTWTTEGTALYYALSVDHITTPYAEYLYRHPELMRVLTFAVLGFEFFGGLMLLLAWPKVRITLVLAFLFMHFNFGLFLELGVFRYAPMVGLIAFLPPEFWKALPSFTWPRRMTAGLLRRARKLPRTRHDRFQLKFGEKVFLALAFLYGVATCGQGLVEEQVVPPPLDRLGRAMGLNQHWPMFIYLDKVKDGWFILQAEFADGTSLDLIHGGEVNWDRPKSVARSYDGVRWRRFMTNIMMPPSQAILPWYSQYLRKNWERKHPESPIERLTIFFMNDPQNLHYRFTPPELKTLDIWKRPDDE